MVTAEDYRDYIQKVGRVAQRNAAEIAKLSRDIAETAQVIHQLIDRINRLEAKVNPVT